MHLQPQPRFPLATTVVWLTGVAGVSCVAAFGLLRFGLGGEPAFVLNVVCLAGGVVWGAAVLGVLPVAALGRQGVLPTAWGYFAGAGLRLAVCLGTYLIAVRHGTTPAVPLAVALAIVYVPLLFVESAIVGRYLWAKDFLLPPDQTQPAHHAELNTQGAVA